MSRFTTALIIFIIITAGSISSVIYVSESEKKLQEHLDNILASISMEDMEKAEAISSEFLEKWNLTEPLFVMLIRHHSVDEITKYAARLTSYCKFGNAADAAAEAQTIKYILRRMSDDEKPTLHNFF